VFGSRGASNFLTRMTTGAAIIFMCTSMGLSWMSSQSRSVVAGEPGDVAPATGLGTEPIEPEGEVAPGTSGEPIDNASADPGNAPLEIELAPPSEEAAAE
jgi:preprotein translocase subunit SecG